VKEEPIVAGKELNERDTKLVQWLNEAHVKEAELEADLAAHISLTEKAAYKKRLQAHLKETKDHKRQVARRIKQLGGVAEVGPLPGAAGEVAGKAVAAVKGQVGVIRAAVTEQAETHLRNAQEELREEHVEIAIYSRIEAFATAVGDKDTAKLATGIRRDEERMAKFLDAELKRLVKDVVTASVPRDQRASAAKRRSTGRARGGTRSAAATSGASANASKPAARAKSAARASKPAARTKPAARSTPARSRAAARS
jgi:ferritin-like metal-binding protein YciE